MAPGIGKSSVPPVLDQIHAWARLSPDFAALSNGDRQLSYSALCHRADRFAGYLVKLGVVPGDAVAICMERSFDWIVAALGILRAGAAYVPLDSAWPDARLRYSVQDAGAVVLVARAALLSRLQREVQSVDPCRDAALIADAPTPAALAIDPASLAYVIYTSGSTGVPKGVEVTHANLAHLISWHRDAFSVTREDRASHLAGLGFDAAVWEIWPHLCAGATLCLADDSVRTSPELIQKWMLRERITIGFVPTIHAAPLMAMEWPPAAPLRFLLTGGDTLHQAPPVLQPFEVVNNYGPTECTVVATSGVLQVGAQGKPSIGRPIMGASIYLLDEHGQPVPDGEVGEIHIGGPGVARGYRNLAEPTRVSFLPDPFSDASGARMYRTGDRGIRQPNGEIGFRGRLDRQTKIRGQRIELDEVSSVLVQHPDIEFATAMAHVSEAGENQLVAYVLPKANAAVPTVHELQQHLLRNLPDWMVPALFIRLQTAPVSHNGKLDLSALPKPTVANQLPGANPQAARSPVEEKLLAMVRQLLENNAVAVEDNFFLAGGHSLLGMQLVMRLGNAFGVDLTLQQLFEAPTVGRLSLLVEAKLNQRRLATIWAELLGQKNIGLDDNFFGLGGTDRAAALQQRLSVEFDKHVTTDELLQNPTIRQQASLMLGNANGQSALPPGVLALQPHGTRSTIFWVHHLIANLAKAVGEHQPLLSVALTAEDMVSLGGSPTFENIAERLVKKILATQPKGVYTIGGYCLGGILAFEIASQLRAAGNEVSLLVLLDPPDPSFLESRDSFTPKLTDPRYILRRAARLGPWGVMAKLRVRLQAHIPDSFKTKFAAAQVNPVRKTIEEAAFEYRPGKYEGKVLLLLASDHPPHVNFLPGWKAVISGDLHTQYVDAHHSDLTETQNMRYLVDAIASHLKTATEKDPVSWGCCASPMGEIRRDTDLVKACGSGPEQIEAVPTLSNEPAEGFSD